MMMTPKKANSKSPPDWPTLLGDNARTGGHAQVRFHSPEKAVWQYRTGSPVRSAPVFHDGVLYAASVNGVLHAINVATGTSKWKFEAAGQERPGRPVVVAGEDLLEFVERDELAEPSRQ